ncbi:MAG: hypothetical protein ACPIGG_08585 [Akkermansiaceae bacterium]
MRSWLGKTLCVIAIIGIVEGHLMVAQSWAWMSMLYERAPEMGVAEAMNSTFSGSAPCSMCCAIAEQQQEQEKEAPVPESRTLAKYIPVSWERGCILMPPAAQRLPVVQQLASIVYSWIHSPPSPPPRYIS